MYHQLWHSEILCSAHKSIYLFCVDLRTSGDYFSISFSLIVFYIEAECLLRGTDWVFKSDRYSFILRGLSILKDDASLGHIYSYIYRMSQEERAKLREGVPYVKLYRYNPKHLYPKLNGYGDNVHRKVWASGVSTYCTPSVTPYSSTAHARQPDTAS